MNITRVVKLTSQHSTPDGVRSRLVTDNGFECVTIERPWADDAPDVSCLPRGRRYRCVWEWSAKHGRDLYHVYGDNSRTGVEIHSANVFEQLKGCLAPGARFEDFPAGSIEKGMPSRDMVGVIASAATLSAFHAAMRNAATGEPEPFWLDIA